MKKLLPFLTALVLLCTPSGASAGFSDGGDPPEPGDYKCLHLPDPCDSA